MKLARTIRFDESDLNIFEPPSDVDEWAISGAFAFSNDTADDLVGKRRQAFANGWLGLETFGRSTFVAVAQISPFEIEMIERRLAEHFISAYGAPDLEAALPVAKEEIAFMVSLCDEHDPNTLLVVERELTHVGVKEAFRAITPKDASLDVFAVHVDT